MSRYQVRKGSQSGHCCFDATVVDTTKPHTNSVTGKQYQDDRGNLLWEAVCETFDEGDALVIAEALNAKLRERR